MGIVPEEFWALTLHEWNALTRALDARLHREHTLAILAPYYVQTMFGGTATLEDFVKPLGGTPKIAKSSKGQRSKESMIKRLKALVAFTGGKVVKKAEANG